MNLSLRLFAALVPLAALFFSSGAFAATSNTPGAKTLTLDFNGMKFVHRWSKDGQNEFTPPNDSDLERWRDMITINVHEKVRSGEQLAAVANGVLSNYQANGKILRTNSIPRTAQREAQHLIVAVLGKAGFLEIAFARVLMVDGVGMAVVYSHRAYGTDAPKVAGEWLKTNGPGIESALMAWDKVPSASALQQLPQSSK